MLLLLAGGANHNIATKRNKTPIYAAVEKGGWVVGVPPGGQESVNVSVAVFGCDAEVWPFTSRSGNRRVVAALLPKCTPDDLRRRTNYGTDVLHVADRNGNKFIRGALDVCPHGTDGVCVGRLHSKVDLEWQAVQ